MWQPTESTIRGEDELFSFTHMAEALDNIISLQSVPNQNNYRVV